MNSLSLRQHHFPGQRIIFSFKYFYKFSQACRSDEIRLKIPGDVLGYSSFKILFRYFFSQLPEQGGEPGPEEGVVGI